MNEVRRRDGVDDDIFQCAAGLAVRSQATAFRFIDRAEESLTAAAVMPNKGSLKAFDEPELQEVRTWRVKGFREYLIYYIARNYGVDVLAVMHGSKPAADVLSSRARGRRARE